MRMRLVSVFAAVVLVACGTSGPGPVKVIGTPEDLTPLTGEWVGTYENRGTGQSGSITFHLTDDPRGAHGDVVFVAPADVVVADGQMHQQPFGGAIVLDIEFVRVAEGEISGRIAPYDVPGSPDGTLETHFAGHLAGDRIEGTFVTYSTHGVGPRRGTWKVRRK